MAVATATCTDVSWNWSFNSLGQSPCLITAYLGSVCNAGQFTVGPLEAGNEYLGPTVAEANECRCSGVFYNLVSACAGCQDRQWLPWTQYNANCSTVYPTIFEGTIPSGTAVPHYAYLDPTVLEFIELEQPANTFNETEADQPSVLDAPESTAPPQATATASPTSLVSPTASSQSKSSSKAGPIAGGVVGGVVALALIAALIFWWTRRGRSKVAPSAEASYAAAAPVSPPPMSYNTSTAPSSFPQIMPSPRLYDPSDPSTYPTAAIPTDYTGSSSTGLHTHITGSSYPLLQPNVTGTGTTPGGQYTGAPEL
ncbi:hypothetical protein H0H92_000065 [Tricholoma furcatifolium]|nr:hypothetical protein H0H92_000065 [Tricholoma furcatifolium]